jgi:hypothetical protein
MDDCAMFRAYYPRGNRADWYHFWHIQRIWRRRIAGEQVWRMGIGRSAAEMTAAIRAFSVFGDSIDRVRGLMQMDVAPILRSLQTIPWYRRLWWRLTWWRG